jgi:branched-chain amino acid transport system permease protein
MSDSQTPISTAGAATGAAPVDATAAANAPSVQAAGGRSFLPRSTLLRHLLILVLGAIGTVILLEITDPFTNSQLAS